MILLLIALPGILFGTELILEIRADNADSQNSAEGMDSVITDRPATPLNSEQLDVLKTRIMALMGVLLALPLIGAWLVARWAVRPIIEMIRASEKILDGQLEESVPIRSRDEVGRLAELINDISANYQELLLCVWDHAGKSAEISRRLAARANESGSGFPDSVSFREDLELITLDADALRSMVKTFGFYDIDLDQEKILMQKEHK